MKKASKASKKSSRKVSAQSAATKPARARKGVVVKKKTASRKSGRGRSASSADVWLPEGLREYGLALQSNGLLTGNAGRQRMSEDVASLFDALHRVLAGGSLSRAIKVKGALNDRTKSRLDRLAKGLVRELNAYRLASPDNVKYG